MELRIFYSWQSDRPNATNRTFIQDALEKAVKSIRKDDSITVEPVIDRDTKDVGGAPDISRTILEKIENAAVFVGDVSIVTEADADRPSPNPNVLIELGYAFKALTHKRTLMVMNTAFGVPEKLPFDLRQRRAVSYSVAQGSTDKATERRKLSQELERHLRVIIEEIEEQGAEIDERQSDETGSVIAALEDGKPNKRLQVRRFVERLMDSLDTVSPEATDGRDEDEALLKAISASEHYVLEFVRVAEVVAAVDDSDALDVIAEGFGSILQRYRAKPDEPQITERVDFDFYRFIGHELFVILIAFLLRERRLSQIVSLLEKEVYVADPARSGGRVVSWTHLSRPVRLLDARKQRLRLNRASLHADVIEERYTRGEIGEHLPFKDFMDADFFLYLGFPRHGTGKTLRDMWWPQSILFMRDPPRFLLEAVAEKRALELLRPLGIKDIEAMRTRITQRIGYFQRSYSSALWIGPLEDFDLASIGSVKQ